MKHSFSFFLWCKQANVFGKTGFDHTLRRKGGFDDMFRSGETALQGESLLDTWKEAACINSPKFCRAALCTHSFGFFF